MVLVCVSTSCLGAGEGGKKAGTGVVRRATDSYYTVSEAPSSQDDSLDSLAGVGPTEFEANAADAHALRGLLASRRGSGSRRGRGGSLHSLPQAVQVRKPVQPERDEPT